MLSLLLRTSLSLSLSLVAPHLHSRGGESAFGGKMEDEISRNLKHTGAGICAMANSGPNTNGSQFYITLKSTPFLDGKHTIFGRIYSGMSVRMSTLLLQLF
jgi:cyclophilin family peptidyl-prolyl cis-trans isomerase